MRVRVSWCFLLFLFVFGLWQVMHVITHVFLPSDSIRHFIYLAIQIVFVSISILLIKREGSSFQEHGFWWPKNLGMYVSVSILLVLVYAFITVFLPGSFMGFELLPSVPQVSLEILGALLTGLASESVFRGYIHSNLTRVYGFLPALCISSVMFSLHRLPLPSMFRLNPIFIFTETVSLFIAGIFLGLFFQRVRTLVCPVTFHVVLLLHYLTPLKAATTGCVALFFEVIAYSFLIFLLYVLVEKKKLELPEIKEAIEREQATQR